MSEPNFLRELQSAARPIRRTGVTHTLLNVPYDLFLLRYKDDPHFQALLKYAWATPTLTAANGAGQ